AQGPLSPRHRHRRLTRNDRRGSCQARGRQYQASTSDACRNCRSRPRPPQVRLDDIADLDGSIGRAEVIVNPQVLHYFDDPGRAIAQARRALKPGGEMLIVDFGPHELEFLRSEHAHRRLGLSEGQMAGWARAAGLGVADLTTFPPTKTAEGLTV